MSEGGGYTIHTSTNFSSPLIRNRASSWHPIFC